MNPELQDDFRNPNDWLIPPIHCESFLKFPCILSLSHGIIWACEIPNYCNCTNFKISLTDELRIK
jgi:hypothetical protein